MNKFPIFRLTIFLAAGIFFAETLQLSEGIYPLVLSALLLVGLGYMLRSGSYGSRWLFGVGIAGFMFLIGMALTGQEWNKVLVDWPSERKVYVGLVQEPPVEKKKTVQCRIKVGEKDIFLYVFKDSLSRSLRIGDELMFCSRIESPHPIDPVSDFDYPRYLYHQGISGTAYVTPRFWSKTTREPSLTWKQQAMLLREEMVDNYRKWGISERALPVLSALTLGYKGIMDQEIREAYSKAGIAHVLALSGMHIGILWLLLNVLLRPLRIIERLRWVSWLLVTVLLWVFAFLVGLEASVIRAVVMCMLMGLGQLAGSKSFSMNTLAIAALFMLLYHPFYLFDVGFQLSFVAVASILYLYRPIYDLFSLKNRVLRHGYGIMSVSMAAQLGTAPLVMYYFSTFSIYFLLANLIAALFIPLIIYGTVLMFALCPFPILSQGLAQVLNLLVEGLNKVAVWTSSLPYSTVGFTDLHPLEIVVFYGFLAVGLLYWQTRHRKWFIGILAMCACSLGLRLFVVWFG